MIRKPSGLQLKYANLNIEEAIREIERDTLLWEITQNTKEEVTPQLVATYYPEIDDEDFNNNDFDEIDITRESLRNLIKQRNYYDNKINGYTDMMYTEFTILAFILAILSIPTHFPTSLAFILAFLVPVFIKIIDIIIKYIYNQKINIIRNQIIQTKNKIKELNKK